MISLKNLLKRGSDDDEDVVDVTAGAADVDVDLDVDEEPSSTRRLILPLVLLIILAGAAYVYMTGGIEPVMQAILGDSDTSPTPASAGTAAQQNRVAKQQAVAIKGKINGQAFTANYVEIRDGVLRFIEGQQSSPKQEIAISLNTTKGEIPENKTFNVNEKTNSNPQIDVRWAGDGSTTKNYSDNYSLELKFKKMVGDKLPGTITVNTNDKDKTSLAGKFVANVEGFRLINGVPDIKADSNDTLVFVALTHILKDDPNKKIKDVVYRNAQYSDRANGDKQQGKIVVEYTIGKKEKVTQQFLLTKEANGWQVTNVKSL